MASSEDEAFYNAVGELCVSPPSARKVASALSKCCLNGDDWVETIFSKCEKNGRAPLNRLYDEASYILEQKLQRLQELNLSCCDFSVDFDTFQSFLGISDYHRSARRLETLEDEIRQLKYLTKKQEYELVEREKQLIELENEAERNQQEKTYLMNNVQNLKKKVFEAQEYKNTAIKNEWIISAKNSERLQLLANKRNLELLTESLREELEETKKEKQSHEAKAEKLEKLTQEQLSVIEEQQSSLDNLNELLTEKTKEYEHLQDSIWHLQLENDTHESKNRKLKLELSQYKTKTTSSISCYNPISFRYTDDDDDNNECCIPDPMFSFDEIYRLTPPLANSTPSPPLLQRSVYKEIYECESDDDRPHPLCGKLTEGDDEDEALEQKEEAADDTGLLEETEVLNSKPTNSGHQKFSYFRFGVTCLLTVYAAVYCIMAYAVVGPHLITLRHFGPPPM